MSVIGIMRRTSAEWTLHNNVLSRDVIGFESDTGKSKIGNGSTAWVDLPYFTGGASEGASSFTDLDDAPDVLLPGGMVCGDADGTALQIIDEIRIDENGDLVLETESSIYLQATDQMQLSANGEGGLELTSSSDAGVRVVCYDGAGFIVSLQSGTFRMNGQTAVASQSVLVAGVGTMVFTHGVLTGFTPA